MWPFPDVTLQVLTLGGLSLLFITELYVNTLIQNNLEMTGQVHPPHIWTVCEHAYPPTSLVAELPSTYELANVNMLIHCNFEMSAPVTCHMYVHMLI